MKVCSKCGKRKCLSSFNWSNEKKGYKRGECKKCALSIVSDWWKKTSPEKRKEQYKQSVIYQSKRADRNSSWLAGYLKVHPCTKCGESRILTLELHHINPENKSYKVSDLVSKGCSLKLIIVEIGKCDVLCANCHRIETAHQLNLRMLKFM